MDWNLILLFGLLLIVVLAMLRFFNWLDKGISDSFREFKKGWKNGFPPK